MSKHSPEVIAEIDRQTNELHAQLADICAGQSVGIVAGAVMNLLGECLVALVATPELFEPFAEQVRALPDKARTHAAPKTH